VAVTALGSLMCCPTNEEAVAKGLSGAQMFGFLLGHGQRNWGLTRIMCHKQLSALMYPLSAGPHTITPFFLQLPSPGYFSVQPTNSSHQHRLPDDLACSHQLECRCGLLQWQPVGDVRRDAAGGKPAHKHYKISLLPGRVKAAQAANG
jgi:hypothetical protein